MRSSHFSPDDAFGHRFTACAHSINEDLKESPKNTAPVAPSLRLFPPKLPAGPASVADENKKKN